MRRGVARRPERALDDGPVGQRDGDEVLGADVGAAQAAGLDQQDARVTVDARGVAERQRDEPRPVDRPVRRGDLVAERLERHDSGSRDPDPHPADAAVRPGEVRDRRELDRRPGGGRRDVRPTIDGADRSRPRPRRAAPRHRAIATSSSSTPGRQVGGLDRIHERPALERDAAADRVDARIRSRDARGHPAELERVTRRRHCRVATIAAPSRRPVADRRPPPSRASPTSAAEEHHAGTRNARSRSPSGASRTVDPDVAVPRVVGRRPPAAGRRPRPRRTAYCWTLDAAAVVSVASICVPRRDQPHQVRRAAGAGIPRRPLALARRRSTSGASGAGAGSRRRTTCPSVDSDGRTAL